MVTCQAARPERTLILRGRPHMHRIFTRRRGGRGEKPLGRALATRRTAPLHPPPKVFCSCRCSSPRSPRLRVRPPARPRCPPCVYCAPPR